MKTTQEQKTARLEARLTAEQKMLVERAAAYEGRSVSDFVVSTIQAAARAVVHEHEVVRLNAAESRAFVELLLGRPGPTAALVQAADDYHKKVVSR